tara:strand:- start:1510 stop:1665 length:156 start_codon:yes stop_codon:yes gene_type:complete
MIDADSLKTVAAGSGTYTVMYLGILPELVSLGIGIATLVYLIVKIIKELNG